jgi:hypothetical protein
MSSAAETRSRDWIADWLTVRHCLKWSASRSAREAVLTDYNERRLGLPRARMKWTRLKAEVCCDRSVRIAGGRQTACNSPPADRVHDRTRQIRCNTVEYFFKLSTFASLSGREGKRLGITVVKLWSILVKRLPRNSCDVATPSNIETQVLVVRRCRPHAY